MSAGNDFSDGRHLASAAALGLANELKALGDEIKIVDLDDHPAKKNGAVGVRLVEVSGGTYIVTVIEVAGNVKPAPVVPG